MYFNPLVNVALVTPPKIASRQQSETAETRGFYSIGNHHEGPHNIGGRDLESAFWRWWEADQDRTIFYTTVRNHFDILSSWFFSGWQHTCPKPWPEKVNTEFLEIWMWHQPKVFTARNKLFRYAWELPRARIMRYETVRDDFDKMLRTFNLGGLRPWEFQWDPSHKSAKKPRDWWNFWETSAIQWVEDEMEGELKRFGYSFPRDRVGKSFKEVFPDG